MKFDNTIACSYEVGAFMEEDTDLWDDQQEGLCKNAVKRANETFFQGVLNGFDSNPDRQLPIDMTIQDFVFVNCQTLAHLAPKFASFKTECVRIDHESSGALDSEESLNQQSLKSGPDDVNLALWQSIAKLPHDVFTVEAKYTRCALVGLASSKSAFQALTSLHICSSRGWEARHDLTDALVSILEQSSFLEILQVEGYSQHKVTIARVARALEGNSSLKSLELLNLNFCHSHVQEIPNLFLQVVEKTNTSLWNLSAYGKTGKVFMFSLEGTCSSPGRYVETISRGQYVDYNCAKKNQYALWLNRCGRGKLRDKATTTEDVAELLVEAKQARALSKREGYDIMLECHSKVKVGTQREGSRLQYSKN